MFLGKAGTNNCSVSLQCFISLADSIGLPIKQSKTVLPTTSVVLHGILFDTEKMILLVPPDKVQKAQDLILQMLRRKKVTLLMIQSLAGLLSFCTKAIPAGRSFLWWLFDLTKGVSFAHQHVNMKLI